jgi:hypothetical protein
MQCPNCGFENMPGNEGCVRCGTSLKLATMTLDVNPPRAGKLSKKMRWATPGFLRPHSLIRRVGRQAREEAAETIGRFSPGRRPMVWRSVIPGWAHLYDGQSIRGHMFLYAWLALGGLGILLFGSTVGSMALGLAMAVHIISIFDLLNRCAVKRVDVPTWMTSPWTLLLLVFFANAIYLYAGSQSPMAFITAILPWMPIWVFAVVILVYGAEALESRLAGEIPPWLLSLIVTAGVIGVMYGPVTGLMFCGAAPVTVPQNFGPLSAGQVVLVNQYLHRGDAWRKPGAVVLYNASTYTVMHLFLHERVITRAQSIGRIVARGACEVSWRHGVFCVDSIPSPWQPPASADYVDRRPVMLGPDQLLVLTADNPVPAGQQALNTPFGPDLVFVDAGEIVGEVYWRCQPIWRSGPVW